MLYTEFKDSRVNLPKIRLENKTSNEDTHTLFQRREDKKFVLLEEDALPQQEVWKVKTINDILLNKKQ